MLTLPALARIPRHGAATAAGVSVGPLFCYRSVIVAGVAARGKRPWEPRMTVLGPGIITIDAHPMEETEVESEETIDPG